MKKNKITLNIFIRSLIIWVIMAMLSIVYCLLSILILGLPIKRRYDIMRHWGTIFIFLSKHLCKVNYIVKGDINTIKSPMIIVANHQSMWETACFIQLLPRHSWVLKKEILRIPFFGWGLIGLRPIAIDRSKRGQVTKQIYTQSQVAFKNGLCVLFFPEGTRAVPNTINPFKLGAFKLSKGLNIPIVPVIHNSGCVLPKGGFCIFPGNVEVIIEKPIFNINHLTEEEIKDTVEKIIHNRYKTISQKD